MDNLKNFPKGVSGNPKGKPKTKLLKNVLTAELQTESNSVDKLTAIIKRLTTMAVNGNLNAIKEVLDRYAGKSVQHNIIEEFKIEPMEFTIIKNKK